MPTSLVIGPTVGNFKDWKTNSLFRVSDKCHATPKVSRPQKCMVLFQSWI